MANNESIKDTLDVIRRALEDDSDFTEKNENVLILNKKINDDIFNVLDAEQSVNQKKSFGSTSPLMVKKSATKWIKKLQNEKK